MLAVLAAAEYPMHCAIKHLSLILALYLGAVPVWVGHAEAAGQEDSTAAEARLARVRARVAALTVRLAAELKERDALAAHLRDADLHITAARGRLDDLRSAEAAVLRQSNELRAAARAEQAALDAERYGLAAQVRAADRMGRQQRLKLLLNQSDPAAAGRMAAFYGYFARDRLKKITDIANRVMHLADLAAQIDQAAARLLVLQADAGNELRELKQARAERLAALAAVGGQLTRGGEELQRLKREEQAEEALLDDLARVLKDFPPDAGQPFGHLRGKLPWPVDGRVTAKYHDARVAAGVRRNGVLIGATAGAKVRAPYFGRVIYADWLPGMGLLLIIGHSDQYMTLYGRAEVLYKSVGDWVAPGDVIAALGESGGVAPQLYFEVREGRVPQDPQVWLRAAP